jgi:hypothetical protein
VRKAEGGEEKKKKLTSRPGAYLAGMAGQCPRGRPGAVEGRLHHGTTRSTAFGASTGTLRSPRRSTAGVRGGAGEVSRSVTTVMQNPEGDAALDLLGEEAADGTVWWGLKRMQGRVICPR